MKKITAIILAAGRGTRMGLETPKQYAALLDEPVLFYSLNEFEKSDVTDIIVVAGQQDFLKIWNDFIRKYNITKCRQVISGGEERFDSVLCGLRACDFLTNDVLIHDAARPMIRAEQINMMIKELENHGAVIAATHTKDTIKLASEEGIVSGTPKRKLLWNAQTPQGFSYGLLRIAYEKAVLQRHRTEFTDDASVVEMMSDEKVRLIDFGSENFKITTQEDLMLAELIMKKRKRRKD